MCHTPPSWLGRSTAPWDRMAFDGCAERLAPCGPCFMRGWPSKRSGLDHWKRPGPLSLSLSSLPPSLSPLLPSSSPWPPLPPAGTSWPIMPGIYCVCAAASLLLTHVAARQSCRPAPRCSGSGFKGPGRVRVSFFLPPTFQPMPGHQGMEL